MSTLLAAVAPAQGVDWQVGLGQRGGFTSNVLSTTALDATVRPVKDGFYGADPMAALRLSLGRVRLEARYDGDVMVFFDTSNGVRQWHGGQVGVLVGLGPIRLSTEVDTAGYRFSPFPEDAFAEVGGRVTADVTAGPTRTSLSFAVNGRFFIEDAAGYLEPRRDRELGGTLRFGVAPASPLWLEVLYTLLDRGSNIDSVDSMNHTLQASARLRIGRVDATQGGSATLRNAAVSSLGLDVTWTGVADVAVEALPWLDVLARYRVVVDRTDPAEYGYAVHEVSLGLRFGAEAGPPEPEEVAPEPTPGGVRFRTSRPGARAVSVVGDFNGWDPDAGHMSGPDEDGVFVLVIPLEPGRYEYQYCVDGSFVAPDDSVRTVPNEFGAPNGVLDVR